MALPSVQHTDCRAITSRGSFAYPAAACHVQHRRLRLTHDSLFSRDLTRLHSRASFLLFLFCASTFLFLPRQLPPWLLASTRAGYVSPVYTTSPLVLFIRLPAFPAWHLSARQSRLCAHWRVSAAHSATAQSATTAICPLKLKQNHHIGLKWHWNPHLRSQVETYSLTLTTRGTRIIWLKGWN